MPNNGLTWEVDVRISYGSTKCEGLYRIQTIKRYSAIREALERIIKENNLKDSTSGYPLRPYQLLGPYRNFCEVSAKCSEDARVKTE